MESLIYAFEGRKSFLTDQCFESSWDETNNIRSVKSRNSASTATLNSVMEFGTIFSCSANEEKLGAPSKLNGTRFATENLVLSTPEPSVSAKRARIMSSQSSIPTCQVLGCNKDLSSSKDYHKRHKVCDVHSKTAVVIVNGIQQRFCQQCSRFHILAEFDEGKRSCRKRLAGHNERRRKPQFDNYLGSTYLSTDASKTSLLFPGSSFYGVRCNKPINHSRHLKFEHDPCQISQKFAANMKFSQSLLNPIMKKQSPSKHHGLNNNTPLSVPESSVGSNSSGALSLLSVQSHTAHHPLISEENYRSTLCTVQNSAIPNLCTSEDFTPMIFNACGVHQGGLTFVPDDISQNEISQNFSDINQRSYFSPDCSETVSLLELSLHLQRVEQQKSQENHVSGNSTYT